MAHNSASKTLQKSNLMENANSISPAKLRTTPPQPAMVGFKLTAPSQERHHLSLGGGSQLAPRFLHDSSKGKDYSCALQLHLLLLEIKQPSIPIVARKKASDIMWLELLQNKGRAVPQTMKKRFSCCVTDSGAALPDTTHC